MSTHHAMFPTPHFDFSSTPCYLTSALTDVANRKRKFNWSARHGYFGDVLCRRSLYAVETNGTYRVEDREDGSSAGTSDVEESATERNVVDSFDIEFNVRILLM